MLLIMHPHQVPITLLEPVVPNIHLELQGKATALEPHRVHLMLLPADKAPIPAPTAQALKLLEDQLTNKLQQSAAAAMEAMPSEVQEPLLKTSLSNLESSTFLSRRNTSSTTVLKKLREFPLKDKLSNTMKLPFTTRCQLRGLSPIIMPLKLKSSTSLRKFKRPSSSTNLLKDNGKEFNTCQSKPKLFTTLNTRNNMFQDLLTMFKELISKDLICTDLISKDLTLKDLMCTRPPLINSRSLPQLHTPRTRAIFLEELHPISLEEAVPMVSMQEKM